MAVISDYLSQLLALLPAGPAWPKLRDSHVARTLEPIAAEFAAVDGRARALLEEAFADTAYELLPDYERIEGLATAETMQERRANLVASLVQLGGQSKSFFENLAAVLGYSVTIEEFRPFRVGLSRVGDPIYVSEAMFAWCVHVNAQPQYAFRVGISCVGEPLGSVPDPKGLEALFQRLKPDHTDLIFSYHS